MNDIVWRFEWKPEDMWIGLFWKKSTFLDLAVWHLWICFVPCFPLHISWVEQE